MKSFKLSLIALLLLCFFALNLSAEDLSQKVPLDRSVKYGKFKNGLTYYLKKNSKPEKRLELRLVVHAGSVLENEDQRGLAHFCEHMCFNGTKNYPKNDLIKALELTGTKFGADVNAYTSFDQTVYMITVPTDSVEALKDGFQILEDWAHQVSFKDDDIDGERGVIMEEWRMSRGAAERIMNKQFKTTLAGSRYGERLPIGDTNVILHHQHDVLRQFYKDWYRPDLMAVIVVGDMDIDQMQQYVEQHFANIPNVPNPRKREYFDVPDNQEPIISIEKDKEMPYSSVEINIKHDMRNKGDQNDFRASLTEDLFSSMLSSRLKEFTTKSNPPFLYAVSEFGDYYGNKSSFLMYGITQSNSVENTYSTMLTELVRVQQHGFTKGELARAKSTLLMELDKQLAEKDKTKSEQYASEFVENFLNHDIACDIDMESELTHKFIDKISLEELNQLSKQYITKKNLIVSFALPDKKDVTIPTKAEVLAKFDEISKEKIKPYVDDVSDKPFFSRKVKAGSIIKEKTLPDFGITEWTLSNGAKVILKPTDFKNNEIIIKAISLGGRSLVTDKDYTASRLSANMVDASGLGDFNNVELDKVLSGKFYSMTPFIEDYVEGFEGSATTKDLETDLQMLNLYFTEPRLDKETYNAQMKIEKDGIMSTCLSPEAIFRDSLRCWMYDNHIRMIPLTLKAIDKVTKDEILNVYKERFADAGDFTFIFTGSFSVDKIKPLIEKYIASLPYKGTHEKYKDLGISLFKENTLKKEIQKGVDPKSTVLMVLHNDFSDQAEDIFLMKATCELLGTRLLEVLREQKSGVYTIYAYPIIDKLPTSTYSVEIGFTCAPERVNEMISSAKDVIDELKTKDMDKSYLQRVKEILKRENENNLKDNKFWATKISNNVLFNADLSEIYKRERRIESLTLEQIKATANKYLIYDHYGEFVLNPEKK